MAWTDIFGGQTVNPQDLSYKSYSFAASVSLLWDNTTADASRVVADIMDVTATVAGVVVSMPDARQAGAGEAALFFNAGAESFDVVSATGVAIITLAPGEAWYVWLRDNTTQSGLWRAIEFGAGTSTASAASLASISVKASSGTLVQAIPTASVSTPGSFVAADRGKMFIWSGGAGSYTLPLAAAVGADWFVHVRNMGTGTLSIVGDGGELVNGASSVTLETSQSATFVCDGAQYFTLGRTSTVVAFAQGTASNPSIAFAGDTNTGLFNPATDAIGVSTGGTEALRVDSSQRVVIGGTSALAKLDVVGPSGVTVFQSVTPLGVRVRGSSGATDYSGIDFSGNSGGVVSNPVARIGVLTGSSGSTLVFGTSNDYSNGITNTAMTINLDGAVRVANPFQFPDGTVSLPAITNTGDTDTGILFPADNTVEIATGGVRALRVDSSQRVVIGGTSAVAKLDVVGPASVTDFQSVTPLGIRTRGSTGTTDWSGIDFTGNSGGSVSNPVARIAVRTASGGSTLAFGTSNDYSNGITNTAMTINLDGTVRVANPLEVPDGTAALPAIANTGDTDTGMFFPADNALGFTTGGTERLRVTDAGNFNFTDTSGTFSTVGVQIAAAGAINATRAAGSTLNLNRLTSDGNLAIFYRSSSIVGSIDVTTTTTTYNTTSDSRVKPLQEPIGNSGALIDAIEPVRHNWLQAPDSWSYGFIAQNVYASVPAAVSKGDDDPDKRPGDEGFEQWGMDPSKLVAVLWAEVRSLRARVAALEAA
jgi:hypothetical protein